MPERIRWSQLPGIPRLTVDFLEGSPALTVLYGGDWRDPAARERVRQARSRQSRNAGLGDAVEVAYKGLEITSALRANLHSLNHPGTLAVVTGQQAGLFGGPLITFYKALTVIFLARRLSEDSGKPVVPLFWMETADSDFSEIDRVSFPPLPPEYPSPARLLYTPRDLVAGRSAHWHYFTPEIEPIRDKMLEWLHPLPFKRQLAAVVSEAYRPGASITEAFRAILHETLGEMGLVIVDPLSPPLIERSRDFWRECLDRPERFNNAFTVAAREIKDLRLPLQVNIREDALPVFWIDETGLRHRLVGSPGEWRLYDIEKKLSADDLMKMVEEERGCFSPAALLRPLLQDWLLPTWIYVGGPSEIAYHAQIGRAYDQINLSRSLIAPRISASLIERQTRRILERQNWKVCETLGGRELLLRTRGTANNLVDLFASGEMQLKGWLERIHSNADAASINLTAESDVAERKMLYQWDKLRLIADRKIMERDKTRVEQADKLQERLMPEGLLQERHDSVLFYLARYGDKLVQYLDQDKDLFNPVHIVVDMERT